MEATYFFLIERKATTIDIQEGWPILDIKRTLELCRDLGVRHPYRGHYPAPFTIDFLITELINGQIKCRAASIKTPEDAAKEHVRRRLKVEDHWCRERGILWALVDTSGFNKTLLSTLRFMCAWFQHRYEPNEENESRFTPQFRACYARNVPLTLLLQKTAKALRVSDALAQDTFRYCAWKNPIAVSFQYPLSFHMPLVLQSSEIHA